MLIKLLTEVFSPIPNIYPLLYLIPELFKIVSREGTSSGLSISSRLTLITYSLLLPLSEVTITLIFFSLVSILISPVPLIEDEPAILLALILTLPVPAGTLTS